MRIRTGLVVALLLALPLAGCARKADANDGVATAGTGKATPSASSGSGSHDPKDEQEQALKFAQCMRDHGIPMADPEFDGGGISITIGGDGTGPDKSKVDAAQEQCKQYMPNNGEPQKLDPATQEQMRKFAECMRSHGITNFPDPSDDGGMMVDGNKLGVDPEGQQFKDAEQACSQYRPQPKGGDGGPGNTEQHVQSGGKA